MSDTGPGASAAPQREAEDDHDLLTYGEVRVRLFHELEAQRALVSELETAQASSAESALAESALAGSAATGSTASERLGRERARLAALQDAADRNRRQPINDENFERFFGYKGTARRNT